MDFRRCVPPRENSETHDQTHALLRDDHADLFLSSQVLLFGATCQRAAQRTHAYFPENLKRGTPTWKGHDIFTTEGARRSRDDCFKIYDALLGTKSADAVEEAARAARLSGSR